MWLMGRVVGDTQLVTDGMACPCDGRCTGASGPRCDCQCGGVNHGSGKLVPVTYSAGPVPVAQNKPVAKLLANANEYRAALAALWDELNVIRAKSGWLPREEFDRKRVLERGLSGVGGLTSHAGRMKRLKSLAKPCR